MIPEENVSTMIKLYIERAEKAIADANWLVDEGKYEIAAGRYYYSCFYAIQSVFLNDGISTRSHKGLQVTFLKDYVKTGKFDFTLGAWLSRMERLRELADYNCAYTITEEEVRQMQQPAAEIIKTAKALVSQ